MNEEPIHCLIADDDEYIATFLQEAISDYAELTTTVVANAEEALDLFSTGIPIEILLTDLHMPGIGGEELIARIHKISPKTLIIVITGNSSIDTAVHLIKEGAYDYLTKPIEITDYLQAVDKAIEQVYAIRNKDFSSDIGKMWHISQLMDKNLTSDKILQGIVDNAIKMSQAQGGILYYFSNDTWETRIKINVSDVQNKIILQNILRAPWENLQQDKITKDILYQSILPDHSLILACPFLDDNKLTSILALHFGKNVLDPQIQGLLAVFASQVYSVVNMANRIYELLRTHEESLKTHAEVDRLHEELKQSTKLACIGELSASLAHDINTPLTCIGGFLQLYLKLLSQEDVTLDKLQDSQTYLVKALEETKRCQTIIRDLLIFSRKESHVYEPFSLIELVQKINNLLEQQFQQANIEYIVDVPLTMSPILGNANQIQQVLMNLLVNAKNAMLEGGKLTLQALEQNDKMEITISDTGAGIAPEHLQKIFEPFFTTKKAGKGTGLGLSITKKIIKEHGGDIKVQSIVGKGTTFILQLPIQKIT